MTGDPTNVVAVALSIAGVVLVVADRAPASAVWCGVMAAVATAGLLWLRRRREIDEGRRRHPSYPKGTR